MSATRASAFKDRWVTLGSLGGLIAGALIGEWLRANGGSADGFAAVGELLFVRPLMLMVVPLIMVSVVSGAASLGATGRLGLLGGATLVYFIGTMAVAATLGALLVSWVSPGTAIDPEAAHALRAVPAVLPPAVAANDVDSFTEAWRSITHQLVPKNVFREMSDGRPLGLIAFSVLIGLGLSAIGEQGKRTIEVVDAIAAAIMTAIGWILWVLPIGVLALVASTIAKTGLSQVRESLGLYMVVVLGGLIAHALIVLPSIQLVCGGGNPYAFLWRIRRALLTAFSTSSSSATLPVTMEACEAGGCSRRATRFVCPLGSTLNMDGTALYEAVAVVFLCQLYGLHLTGTELAVVVVTATLAAIGAAGIPSAGLVTMVLVVQAVNASLGNDPARSLPVEAIGIIIGVDRLLDMVRTTVNVQGDAFGARLLTRLAPDAVDADAASVR